MAFGPLQARLLRPRGLVEGRLALIPAGSEKASPVLSGLSVCLYVTAQPGPFHAPAYLSDLSW